MAWRALGFDCSLIWVIITSNTSLRFLGIVFSSRNLNPTLKSIDLED
jgi:hypothetical protein